MKKLCQRDINASEISEFLNLKWSGDEFYIKKPVSALDAEENSIFFLKDSKFLPAVKNAVCIADKEYRLDCRQLVVADPELAFYRIINEFFTDDVESEISPLAIISPNAKIGRGVAVGDNSFIGEGAVIGANTQIGRGVSIYGNVCIGAYSIIKDNAVLGSMGYGFVADGEDFLHIYGLGKISLGERVLIGCCATVELPSFGETVICDNTKIDDLVNIGSACKIGKNSLVAAGSIFCHNVFVGAECHIGPGVCVKDGVKIGNGATIGLGSTVIDDVCDNDTVAGNPARKLEGK